MITTTHLLRFLSSNLLLLPLALLFLLLTSCQSTMPPPVAPAPDVQYLQYNDSTAWNLDKLAQTAQYADRLAEKDLPLTIGVFPTPPYASAGNGSRIVDTTVYGRRLLGYTAYLARDEHNADRLPAGQDIETYFTILVVTDPGEAYTNEAFVSSSNHPTYLGEGRIGHPDYRVDWLALVNDAQRTAVVNMRYFDLTYGGLVIVRRLPDFTLRLLQLEARLTPAGHFDPAASLTTPRLQDFLEGRQ